MRNSLEDRVRKTIQKYGMLDGGEHVVIAVSGGADSTALLLCLHRLAPELRLTLTVAHLNHRIRGAEADQDEEFVRRMSASLALPFLSETIDVRRQAKAAKQNLEESARRIRYDFLNRAAHRAGAQKIAVGHNLNDQAETVIFRFIRGSGIEGLSAIHPVVRGIVIRPLLECSRSSILEYLKQREAAFREDASNLNFQHARNRIRRELIPYLEQHFNPQLIETLAREALLARETSSFLESRGKELFNALHFRSDESLSINIAALLRMHSILQKQVLREALRECLGSLRGVTSRHVESILSLCRSGQSGSRIQLPHGCTARRQFDEILLFRQPVQPVGSFIFELSVPGRSLVSETGDVITASICSTPDLQTIKRDCAHRAFLEPSVLPAALTVRSREPGDRYGGPGHRKVKKMLIDRRISLPRRAVLPMIVAGDAVIWIPGFRPARGYEARPGSRECVMIELGQGPDAASCSQINETI